MPAAPIPAGDLERDEPEPEAALVGTAADVARRRRARDCGSEGPRWGRICKDLAYHHAPREVATTPVPRT